MTSTLTVLAAAVVGVAVALSVRSSRRTLANHAATARALTQASDALRAFADEVRESAHGSEERLSSLEDELGIRRLPKDLDGELEESLVGYHATTWSTPDRPGSGHFAITEWKAARRAVLLPPGRTSAHLIWIGSSSTSAAARSALEPATRFMTSNKTAGTASLPFNWLTEDSSRLIEFWRDLHKGSGVSQWEEVLDHTSRRNDWNPAQPRSRDLDAV